MYKDTYHWCIFKETLKIGIPKTILHTADKFLIPLTSACTSQCFGQCIPPYNTVVQTVRCKIINAKVLRFLKQTLITRYICFICAVLQYNHKVVTLNKIIWNIGPLRLWNQLWFLRIISQLKILVLIHRRVMGHVDTILLIWNVCIVSLKRFCRVLTLAFVAVCFKHFTLDNNALTE